MDWIYGIQNAINYIEDHITEELDFEEIAKQSFSSSFHFQRVTGSPNDKQLQDHNFACESRLLQYILEGASREHVDSYQILTNFDADGYDFYFAQELPKYELEDFDEFIGEMCKYFEHVQIPAGLYMVCETERCKYPTNLEDELRRKAVSQWLPSSEFQLRDAPEIGLLHWFWEEGNDKLNNSRYAELWLPIEKKA